MSVILSRPQCVNLVMMQVLAWRICVVPGRQELTLNACLSDDSAYLLGYIHRHRGRPSIEWSGGRFFCLYSRLPHLEDKGHRWLVILNSYKASAWIWTMRMDERETDTTWIMMTSSNGNIFGVTDLMCGEFTGPRCIPLTKASDSGVLMVSLICAWTNVGVNNRDAGLETPPHYDVTAMMIYNQTWLTISRYTLRRSTLFC